jgi:hypothetical protein
MTTHTEAQATMQSVEPEDRNSLSSRILPQMTLSKGDESSLTGPPAPDSGSSSAQERAVKRFEVAGNAM